MNRGQNIDSRGIILIIILAMLIDLVVDCTYMSKKIEEYKNKERILNQRVEELNNTITLLNSELRRIKLEKLEAGTEESPSRHQSTKVIKVTATAYTPYDQGMDGKGRTFSGHPADIGVVAVDPKIIPLYSVVYIPSYGYAIALDTGGAIKGHRIDVFFWNKEQAMNWGVRDIEIRIIQTGG